MKILVKNKSVKCKPPTVRDAVLRLLECQMETVLLKLDALNTRIDSMANSLDAIKAAVARNNDIGDSCILLLKDIAAKLAAAATDPVEIQAIADQLNEQADQFATAITENTPA